MPEVRIVPTGDAALLVELPARIDCSRAEALDELKAQQARLAGARA